MRSSETNRLLFYKMHGGGNDFVVMDHRERFIPEAEQPGFARRVCHRQLGAGADGLILIEASLTANTADFRWRFYNADGSEPEMCGNGGRCAARFAVMTGIAPAILTFDTLAGVIKAEVKGRLVKLLMAGVGDFRKDQTIPLDEANVHAHFVRVGVPHLVVPVDDIEAAPVTEWGRLLRFHQMFQPAGTNVNFIRVEGPQTLRIRTYERGVEDETLACGTGAVASALIAARLGQVVSPVTVHTRGGEALTVYFTPQGEAFTEVFLEGDALVVYQGELWVDELK
ncbi:MAG: diaminopimelate epimerase [Desulfobacca sp. RBG_16_60_12]|nr:MAG: diaminopimelate epimerase [Desulfobacca sp. RBG_16_60_12]